MSSETLMLEKIIKKISKVSELMMQKDPLDADRLAQMGEADRAVLQGYQVIAAPNYRDLFGGDFPEITGSEPDVDQEVDSHLEGAVLERRRLTEWDFNPFDLNE